MRANPSTILALAAICLSVPAASARPAHKPAPKAKTVSVSAKRPAKHGRKAEAETPVMHRVHGRLVPVKPATEAAPKLHRVHGKLVPVKPEADEPVKMRRVHGKLVPVEPEPVKMHRVHGRLVPVKVEPKRLVAVARPAPVVREEPAPEPAPALAEIHVRHNRKEHLTAPDAGAEAAPHKATTADFITDEQTAATPADTPEAAYTGVSHPDTDDERAPREPAPIVRPMADAEPAPRLIVPAPRKERLAPAVIAKELKPVAPAVMKDAKPAPVLLVKESLPEPVVLPALYTKRGKLIVPPALKGSHEILLHQNQMADSDGLERIQDDEDLEAMRRRRMLVALPVSSGLVADERLPANRRYARPWTAAFLTALSRAHYDRFHTPLQVNSAVRTVEFQTRLMRTNGNAAPAEGETASPHLTGQAVDLAKHGLSLTEIAWLRGYLLPLVQQGKVDVEEEFQQACFHISVYKKYLPSVAPKREIAPRRGVGSVLAVAIP